MTKSRYLIVAGLVALAMGLCLSGCGTSPAVAPAVPAPAAQPAASPSLRAAEAPSPAPAAVPTPSAPPQQPPPQQPPKATALPAPAPTPAPAPVPAPSQKARILGEIVYEEGTVTIRRGDRILSGVEADMGAAIQAFDLVATGPASRVEIDLASSSSGGALIRIGERTAFYFDTASYDDGSRKTLVKLLSGTIAFKVEKLTDRDGFTVSSGGAVLGVRGTTFSIDIAPDGSILISCVEGRVDCSGSDGRGFSARPGTLVEGGEDGNLAPKALPAEKLSANRAAWLVDAEAANGRKGASVFLSNAKALGDARPAFDAAFASLESHSSTLASWERLLASGRKLGPAERLDERKALATALLECLKALPAFETPWYRLADLASRKASGLALGGTPDAQAALGPAIVAFASGKDADESRLGRLRRALFIFSRLEADTPLGEFFAEKSASFGGGASLFSFGH